MTLLGVTLAAVIGAVFRRWFGGGFISSPRWLRVCSGFVLAMVVAGVATGSIWGLLAGLLAAATWTLGHGSYMDMGNMPKPDNEFLKPVLDLMFKTEPSQVRDFVGMALVYSVFTIPAGVCLIWHNFAGWFLLPVGVLVACAYWLGWRFLSPRNDRPVIFGEYAAGALVYGALGLA